MSTQPEAFNEHDALFNRLKIPEQFHDLEYESILGAMDFDRLQLGDVVLSLLIRTAEFRHKAMSYRGFNVGAGAMVSNGHRVGRVLGFNAKLDDTDRVNIHAEDLVTAKATDLGFENISVLSVVAPTQEDGGSGLIMPTLHPCGRCRDRLAHSHLVNDETLIVTAKPDFTAIELSNIAALQAAHEQEDYSGITTFLFDKTPEVFSPLPSPNKKGVIEVHEDDIDDSDWQETVGSYLMARYALKRFN